MADTIATEIASAPTPPALSATSDMPVAPTPEAKPDAAPPTPEAKPAATETPAAEGAAGEAGAPGAEGEDGEGEDGKVASEAPAEKPDRTLSGRLSQRTRERNEERGRADQLATLLEKAIEKLGTGTPAPAADGAPPSPPAAPDPRPQRTAFDDPDAYDSALIEWSTRQSTRLATAEFERRQTAERQQEQQRREREQGETKARQDHDHFQSQRQELVKNDPQYADFDDVAFNDDVQIAAPLVPMIVRAGPKVLYHLGKNPDEALALSKLVMPTLPDGRANPDFDPLEASYKIGEIRARVTAAARPQVSSAPKPITPINGGQNRAVAKTPNDMSMEEYAEQRLPKLQGERRSHMFGNRTN